MNIQSELRSIEQGVLRGQYREARILQADLHLLAKSSGTPYLTLCDKLNDMLIKSTDID